MTEPNDDRPVVLLFAPHPDDETLGPGGTLARRVGEGFRVEVAVLTDGSQLFRHGGMEEPPPAEVARLRADETRRALEILGVGADRCEFWNLPDGQLQAHADAATDRAEALLRRHRPVEVLSTSVHEHHKDHVTTAEIVARAIERSGQRPLHWGYITSLRWGLSLGDLPEPIQRVDTAEFMDRKRQAIHQFQAHLGIVSPHQSQPLVDSWERYVTPEEVFIGPAPSEETRATEAQRTQRKPQSS